VIEEYQRRNARQRRPTPAVAEPASTAGEELALPPLALASAPSSLRRFLDITLSLARAEFKLRYLDSAVGYVWALAQPLLWFGVLYLVWTEIFHVRSDIPNFTLGLLVSIVLYTFFTESTGHSLNSLVNKGTMLRKIPFPAVALPISSVLTSCVVYALALVIAVAFILASGISPTWQWLEMVPVLLLTVTFAIGMSLVLSFVYVGLRDVEQVWQVACRLLFFLTPIFYPIQLVPSSLADVVMVNPLAVACVQARHALVDPNGPSAVDAAGAWPVAGSLTLTAGVLGLGLWLYWQRSGRLAERI
jgi:ABC-2 type transport system permease protein